MARVLADGTFDPDFSTDGFATAGPDSEFASVVGDEVGGVIAARFCPDEPVSRWQMAAFLIRILGEPDGMSDDDVFSDDNGSVSEDDIEALAAWGVARGCNSPENTRFCPEGQVTRGQMAAFLVRGFFSG